MGGLGPSVIEILGAGRRNLKGPLFPSPLLPKPDFLGGNRPSGRGRRKLGILFIIISPKPRSFRGHSIRLTHGGFSRYSVSGPATRICWERFQSIQSK